MNYEICPSPESVTLHTSHLTPGCLGEVVEDRIEGNIDQGSLVEDEGEEVVAGRVLAVAKHCLAPVVEGRAEGDEGEGLGDLVDSLLR